MNAPTSPPTIEHASGRSTRFERTRIRRRKHRAAALVSERQGSIDSADPELAADTKGLLCSLFVHLIILIGLSLITLSPPPEARHQLVLVPPDRERELETDRSFDMRVEETPLPEIGSLRSGLLDAEAEVPDGGLAEPTLTDFNHVKPSGAGERSTIDLRSIHSAALSDELAGVKGDIVDTRGDIGSVDRITTEILGHLELSDVLVVWLMDASESMRPRRSQIIQRFDRVYDELDVASGARGESLLTAVAAFGSDLIMMTSAPTNDREVIQNSVIDIQSDETGIERVFSAIKSTAIQYASTAREGRKVMMIVVTDESGNDASLLDETAALLRRHEMSVYVMGPMAPFAREELIVKWVDPQTTDTYFLPVDCGPETPVVEQARMSVWDDGPGAEPVSSGFGPYGLTRIAHENGGMYLMADAARIPGPNYELRNMMRFRPDYVAPAEYQRRITDNPLRLAVLRTSQAIDQIMDESLGREFLAGGIQFEIKATKKRLAKTFDALNRGLNELDEVERSRKKETSARWLAHYDLLKGRLLANRIRCYSYEQQLNEMYNRPCVPADGTKNAWKLAPSGKAADGKATDAVTVPAELADEAERARKCLAQVIADYPDTPWATLAQEELNFGLAFVWQETFLDPPDGIPLPWDKVPWHELTPKQKEAKVEYDKKKQALTKQKEAAAAGPKKRPPPKI